MRLVGLIAAALGAASPSLAADRTPSVQQFIDYAVASHVVPEMCPGLSLNPQVVAMAVMAVGLSGEQAKAELDSVTESEILALAATARKSSAQAPERCAALRAMTVPEPFAPGKMIPIYIYSQK